MSSEFPGASYDNWKQREPDYGYDPEEYEHEDTCKGCPDCKPDENEREED